MDAFIYRAALFCPDCARDVMRRLPAKADDSDAWPQGPYPHGGGEADAPQHCDKCGVFLENPLTPEGGEYVEALAAEHDTPGLSWAEIADRADAGGAAVLADWIRFYLAPGL